MNAAKSVDLNEPNIQEQSEAPIFLLPKTFRKASLLANTAKNNPKAKIQDPGQVLLSMVSGTPSLRFYRMDLALYGLQSWSPIDRIAFVVH